MALNPYMSFRFRIEIYGITNARASEVTGLQIETETESFEEGGVNNYVHQLPKRTKYQHITLKRGITDNDELWNWYQDVVNGDIERKNGAIVLMDLTDKIEGSDIKYWAFEGAYPVKWTGPDLKADSNVVAFETIELVHHGIWKG
jgi:phage tail-like protein